jgi:hypothetical protein
MLEKGTNWSSLCALFLTGYQGHDHVARALGAVRSDPTKQVPILTIRTGYVLLANVWQQDEWEASISRSFQGRYGYECVTCKKDGYLTDLGEVCRVEASQQWCVC